MSAYSTPFALTCLFNNQTIHYTAQEILRKSNTSVLFKIKSTDNITISVLQKEKFDMELNWDGPNVLPLEFTHNESPEQQALINNMQNMLIFYLYS